MLIIDNFIENVFGKIKALYGWIKSLNDQIYTFDHSIVPYRF